MNICFIPARGGSKSIKNKNIVTVGGRPLIEYVLEASIKSQLADRVVVSTDSAEIADVVLAYASASGNFVDIDHRSSELSRDDTNVKDVILDYIRREGASNSVIALVQPTSPLVRSSDIDGCFRVLSDCSEYNGYENVVEIPHNFHAFNQRIVKDGVVDFYFRAEREKLYRKQDKPKLYKFGNLLGFRGATVEAENTLFVSKRAVHVIDSPFDFDLDLESDILKFEEILKG